MSALLAGRASDRTASRIGEGSPITVVMSFPLAFAQTRNRISNGVFSHVVTAVRCYCAFVALSAGLAPSLRSSYGVAAPASANSTVRVHSRATRSTLRVGQYAMGTVAAAELRAAVGSSES